MALIPSPLDYTDKDFAALKARLVLLAKSAFPQWTDYQAANFGNIMLEMFAFVGDVLGFYQDAQAGESRWSTAQLRSSLLALVKMIDYKPEGARASRADLVISLATPPIGNVLFPKGLTIYTEGQTPISYELMDAATILSGADPPEVTVTAANWKSYEETFAASGKANQEIVLSYTPFLEEELVVEDNGGAYTLVDNFLQSDAADRHFTVTVDHKNRATLRFGNGVNGVLPTGTIVVSYKVGGGTAGEVGPGTLTRLPGAYYDLLNNPVQVTVTNPEASSPAVDAETTAQIRENAPRSIRALTRTVAREDFEIHAEEVTGVARALMFTSNEDGGIAENYGHLYIVPDGAGVPDQDLKDAVLEMVKVTKPHTLTFDLEVRDPVYVTVNVKARIFLKPKYTGAQVKASVTEALTNWFALYNEDGSRNTNVDFGFNYKDVDGNPAPEIPLSTLMNLVKDADGVRKIGDASSDFLVNLKHQDLAINAKAFPKLGTITLINGDTGVTL